MILFVNELAKMADSCFIVGFIWVFSANEVLGVLNKLNFRVELSTKKSIFLKSRKFSMREISLYRELFMWIEFVNRNFCYFVIPPLLFFGLAFIILGLYGTIRMQGEMHFLLYCVVPLATGMALGFVVLLVPEAAKLYERSVVYLEKVGRDLRRTSWEKRVINTLRPLAVKIGPFGLIKNSLMKIVVRVLTENTMTLLITFR